MYLSRYLIREREKKGPSIHGFTIAKGKVLIDHLSYPTPVEYLTIIFLQ